MSIPLKRLKQILKPGHYEEFSKWIAGQTLEKIGNDWGVYEHDFVRWVKKLPVVD